MNNYQKVNEAYENVLKEQEEYKTITITLRDSEGEFKKLIDHIKGMAGIGHSFEVVTDPDMPEYKKRFFIDGDGSFRIDNIKEK